MIDSVECPKCLASINVIKDGKTPASIPKQKYKCTSCVKYFVLDPLKVHGIVKPSIHAPTPSVVTVDGDREETMAALGRRAGISREYVRRRIRDQLPILGKLWSKEPCTE